MISCFQRLFPIFQLLFCLWVPYHISNLPSFSFLPPMLYTVENCAQLRKASNLQIWIKILTFFRLLSSNCLIFIKPLTVCMQFSSQPWIWTVCALKLCLTSEGFMLPRFSFKYLAVSQSQTLILISFTSKAAIYFHSHICEGWVSPWHHNLQMQFLHIPVTGFQNPASHTFLFTF